MRNMKTAGLLVVLIIAAAITVLLLAGHDDETRDVSLYFYNKEGSILVPVESEIKTDGSDIYEKVAEALIKGPSSKKYKPIMDKGVKLNWVKNENGSLTADFSEEYKGSGVLTTYAVIKSFCRLDDVFRVRITADGEDVTEDGGFISGDEINLEDDDYSAQGVTLYFADGDRTRLVREYRKINITDTQPIEQYIVAELIKGPKNSNNVKLFAADTGILSVETTDGTCYVNFKQDFIDKNTASAEVGRLIIYSVVNSLTERDGIDNVQFLIDGKKTESFGEMNISELFYRRDDLIKN